MSRGRALSTETVAKAETSLAEWRRRALIFTIVSFLVAAVVDGATKGLWFDELFSVYEARLEGPVGSLMWHHWLRDGHPPWFNLGNWLARPLVGDSILAKRALNLVPALSAGGALWYLIRWTPKARNFLFGFAMLLLATPDALEQIIEHRVNFTQLAAMTVIMAGLGTITLRAKDYDRDDRVAALLLAGAILIACNLHYLAALSAGLIVGLFAIREYRSGRWRWAVILLTAAAISALPLVGSIVVQQALLSDYMHGFWNATPVSAAAVIILGTLFTQAIANPVVSFAALVDLVDRQPAGTIRRRAYQFAATCLGAALTVFVILLVTHIFRPVVIARYLVTEIPPLLAALAMIAASKVGTSRGWICATAVGAVFSIAVTGWKQYDRANWNEGARIVAAVVQRCPDTAVHTPLVWNKAWLSDGVDFADVMRYGYARVGRDHAFVTEPSSSRRLSHDCPTLVWVEHTPGVAAPNAAAAANGLPLPSWSIARGKVIPTTSGFVTIFPAETTRVRRVSEKAAR